jgi:hypothetical protein
MGLLKLNQCFANTLSANEGISSKPANALTPFVLLYFGFIHQDCIRACLRNVINSKQCIYGFSNFFKSRTEQIMKPINLEI